MADVIKFEFDQPVEVSLRFAEPKVFASSFPGGDDRHMYSTTDGRVMYVTPLTSARIAALKLQQGECFFICKRKSGRLTEFAVFRELDEAPAGHFGGHKKTYPPQKPNLPERLYYRPELSPEAEATLEQQLQASIEMAERRKAIAVGQQQNGTFAVPAPRTEAIAVSSVPRREVPTSGVNGNATTKPVVPVKIPMDRAVVDAVKMVQAAMKETGEQWSDSSKQDLVSTILIAASRSDWISGWRQIGDAK
jgi:hypothetical protein